MLNKLVGPVASTCSCCLRSFFMHSKGRMEVSTCGGGLTTNFIFPSSPPNNYLIVPNLARENS